MEKIEKKILRKLKLITEGNNKYYVPDDSIFYNIKICLTSKNKDFGYFDVIDGSDGIY